MEELERLLAGCPDNVRSALQKTVIPRGGFILHQGDELRYVTILLSGQAKNVLDTPNGICYQTYASSPGDIIGEIEAFGGYPVICSVQAFTDCEILRIPWEEFHRWVDDSREFCRYCFRQLTTKLYNANQMTTTNLAYPLRYRIESVLWNMAAAGNKYIEKDDVVHVLGAKLRSVNRILHDLIDEGLIECDEGTVKVLSLEKLGIDLKRQEI